MDYSVDFLSVSIKLRQQMRVFLFFAFHVSLKTFGIGNGVETRLLINISYVLYLLVICQNLLILQ